MTYNNLIYLDEIYSFKENIYHLMRYLPDDKITTYGDLAAMAGKPFAARIVGNIAHGGPDYLPWHRLVNARGYLAVGFPGGQDIQRQLLEQDGIFCDEFYHVINFSNIRWNTVITIKPH